MSNGKNDNDKKANGDDGGKERKVNVTKLPDPVKVQVTAYPPPPNTEVTAGFNAVKTGIDGVSTQINTSADTINTGIKASIDGLTNEIGSGITVRHARTASQETNDLALWVVIRRSANALSFTNYARFMDAALCGKDDKDNPISLTSTGENIYESLRRRRFLPFNDTDGYRLLKVATEAFLMVNSGIIPPVTRLTSPPTSPTVSEFTAEEVRSLNSRMGGSGFNDLQIQEFWNNYCLETIGSTDPILPYMFLIRGKLKDEPLKTQMFRFEDLNDNTGQNRERCVGVLQEKLINPILLELIWSYWHEEGMLVQTMNTISRRFQNVRSPNGRRDPLANLEIDPLRPLNNLLWSYVQDEQHRLSVVRRVYEYDHHYGIALQGKAIPKLHTADSRSKFIEAFHHLLYLCSVFFKQDDDTTVISDGFSILNGLREVHLILSQGAHNQFGDLPSTARQEMLIQQWLLARPEFREFLPTRTMVAYPEPWMDRVDAMKSLQNWTDVSIDHFNRLAVFGEQILLSIRFGAWSDSRQTPPGAANWARFWRAEIQGYIHDYRAVTGVDLTSSSKVDGTPPSVHLFKRFQAQARRV